MKWVRNVLKKAIWRTLFNAYPEVCMDVAKWALEQKLPVTELYPPVVDEVQPHIKDDTMARDEFVAHRQALERPQTLLTIENASIRDVVGLVELPDGKICYEGNWWMPHLQEHPAYQRRGFFKNRYLKGNWYSFLSMWSTEYYHWFHDVLPRLENAFAHLPPDTRFLINEAPRAYQLESLKAYGITAGQLELQPIGRIRTKVEYLWFATPLGHQNLGSGKVISQVALRLKKHFAPDEPVSRSKKVYVSRKKAACRRIVNELDLKSILENFGFEIMMLEDMAWHEQVRLFSGAEAIMGPHGAGLTNMIFAPKCAAIWEIVPKDPDPYFVVLARQLGHQFHRLHADCLDNNSLIRKKNADMRLPPQNLFVALNGNSGAR